MAVFEFVKKSHQKAYLHVCTNFEQQSSNPHLENFPNFLKYQNQDRRFFTYLYIRPKVLCLFFSRERRKSWTTLMTVVCPPHFGVISLSVSLSLSQGPIHYLLGQFFLFLMINQTKRLFMKLCTFCRLVHFFFYYKLLLSTLGRTFFQF